MTKDLMYREEIQEMVRDVYSDVGDASAPAARFYRPDQLRKAPEEAVRWALGVGNPLRHADLSAGEHVVDLGSGAGIDALLAATEVGPDGSVTGVDFVESMISRSRRIAAEAGHGNVEFVQGSIDDLPLEDDSADVVISNGAINLAARKSRVFAEARRILRPDGRLSISDLTIDEEDLPSEVLVHPSAWAG